MKQNSSYFYKNLIIKVIDLAWKAGLDILDVYHNSDFEVEIKSDKSPLTIADKRSHLRIEEGLKITKIPVLSEESAGITWEDRREWDQFWLVDPLDGTKEFIKRNDEFTVNIALIENGKPVMGVIYLPVFNEMYFGLTNQGSFKISDYKQMPPDMEWDALVELAKELPAETKGARVRVVASRSHLSDETKEFINELEKENGAVSTVAAGSSLKLCLIAEGKAEIYPRLGPTMEWDIGAGHSIIEAAGGSIQTADGKDLLYNKENLLNPWFIARSKYF
ncbi:MAG: 3'(2'),5'-bisphosphate nucleotidase CysQ [Bacteroidales bacterium]|nr:3'(2'),5'-bisphosphate nucleotidase CysQ [Bacteroidales bacterium]